MGTLLAFLFTAARVAGVFVFVPMPGLKSGMDMARVVLSVAVTFALFPYWPNLNPEVSIGLLLICLVSEAAIGIGAGLAIAFATEAFAFAAQLIGLQAGYAYASTIDPTTEADSAVLTVFAQLATGLIFFAFGADREVIRVFADSLQTMPPGSVELSRVTAERLLAAGGTIFSTGLRLALPVIAVLVMVDISLALLCRINAQLQLLTIAFPVKMALALLIFGWVLILFPPIFRNSMDNSLLAAKSLFAG
jgi:flagellar biosynthetic protein FliR